MQRRLDLTAAQTALLAGLGALMVSCGFLGLGLGPRRHSHAFLDFMITSLVLLALGIFLNLSFESRLKEGIANESWDTDQIERLRNLFESLWWKALPLALLVAGAASIVLAWRKLRSYMGLSVSLHGRLPVLHGRQTPSDSKAAHRLARLRPPQFRTLGRTLSLASK